ncbi:MAG: hypothetical protein EA382_07715 [Spirochaetaceae bacterium]|nr:MAG: hypothetical protein EA382_07715 [Spirochaetaceae bacterium]
MAGWLAVLVDNRELVRIARLRHGAGGALNLTTMLAGQDQAVVHVYVRSPKVRERIHTFHLRDLTSRPERPRIVVSAHVRDDVTVALRVNGELREERRIAIPDDALRPAVAGWLVLALLILLLAAGTIWWVSRGRDQTAPGFTAAMRDRIVTVLTPTAALPDVSGSPGDAVRAFDQPTQADAEVQADAEAEADAITRRWTIYFEPDSAVITDDARRRVDELAAEIAGSHTPRTIEITGHTALFGSEASRIDLSVRRADAIAQVLSAVIDDGELTVVGAGGTDPVTFDPDRQPENRRVEIRALP